MTHPQGLFQVMFGAERSVGASQITSNLTTSKEVLPTKSFAYVVGKRIFDIGLALILLPLAGPLILLVSAAIALSSGGPVFYRQRRVGLHGRPFTIWKFRTMYSEAERILDAHLTLSSSAQTEWRHKHKLHRDPRVIPIGRVLRETSLDELPQILNVLAGHMSFVGPRPIVRKEVLRYAERFPYYVAAKPGITGLWQISGRCTLPYDVRVALDEQYVRHWSMKRDILILLRTPRVVMRREGAF